MQISVILSNIHTLLLTRATNLDIYSLHLHFNNDNGYRMRHFFAIIFLLFFSLSSGTVSARVLYGYTLSEAVIEQKAREKVSLELAKHPLMNPKTPHVSEMARPHTFKDRTADFLVVAILIALLGIFRITNPSYFRNLFRAFRNPTLSTRQLREQLRQNSAATLVMDIFFCISLGLYLFFLLQYTHRQGPLGGYPPGIIMLGCVLLFIVVYLVRFLFLKFTGWVFHIPEITDNYTFNVFLINKILGIAIIPFTIILAFGQGAWVQVALLVSGIVVLILLLNRYLRSGVAFGYFLKFSKFHFFMYLCASELLPIAVLVKLFSGWLNT